MEGYLGCFGVARLLGGGVLVAGLVDGVYTIRGVVATIYSSNHSRVLLRGRGRRRGVGFFGKMFNDQLY